MTHTKGTTTTRSTAQGIINTANISWGIDGDLPIAPGERDWYLRDTIHRLQVLIRKGMMDGNQMDRLNQRLEHLGLTLTGSPEEILKGLMKA